MPSPTTRPRACPRLPSGRPLPPRLSQPGGVVPLGHTHFPVLRAPLLWPHTSGHVATATPLTAQQWGTSLVSRIPRGRSRLPPTSLHLLPRSLLPQRAPRGTTQAIKEQPTSLLGHRRTLLSPAAAPSLVTRSASDSIAPAGPCTTAAHLGEGAITHASGSCPHIAPTQREQRVDTVALFPCWLSW